MNGYNKSEAEPLMWILFSILPDLSRKFTVKLCSRSIVLNFAVIFVDVVSDGKQGDR